jgi:phosphomevalonate kinase
MTTTVASAPGKVLLAGGYLILDRPHAGTVVALDARFYSGVEFVAFADQQALEAAAAGLVIEVHSPQFRDERRYVYRWGSSAADATLELLPRVDGPAQSPNRYVEVPLLYGLTLIRHRHGHMEDGGAFFREAVERAVAAGQLAAAGTGEAAIGLRITLCADNGFYSQAAELRARGLPMSAASLRALPPMLPPRTDDKGDLAKTGLGSSATLVTSLLGALLHAFGAVELPAGSPAPTTHKMHNETRRGGAALAQLHALAQLCHCTAQGKVGSGFDVCSAVYGSQRYTRFSPALLAELLALQTGTAPPPDQLLRCIGEAEAVDAAEWDHIVEPFQLPPGIDVVMADGAPRAMLPAPLRANALLCANTLPRAARRRTSHSVTRAWRWQ